MEWIDDNGFELNGGSQQISGDNVPTFNKKYFNNNIVADGAIVSGNNNIIQSGDGVIVSGESNVVGAGSRNISLLASTGVTVLSGVSNVSITNSSGVTVTESNTTYDNNIKTYNNVSYKRIVILLNQTGVNPPIATILENTFDVEPVFSYNALGNYVLTMTGQFTASKTLAFINQTYYNPIGNSLLFVASRLSDDDIGLQAYDPSTLTYYDGLYNDTALEIRVYS